MKSTLPLLAILLVLLVGPNTSQLLSTNITTCLHSSLSLDQDLQNAFVDYFNSNSTGELLDILKTTSDMDNLLTCNFEFVGYLLQYTTLNATSCANAILAVQMQELSIAGEWSNMIAVTDSTLFYQWAQVLYNDVLTDLQLLQTSLETCS